ncbi:pisatin demethylase [Podospora didyma]|uniref:Pisatin demethylase n=1 Tax=Podospora didyma TaxID=330526 RepID=A0AAE0K2S4_9PEZI|nr:pisatin demethylase [Podospora didyma]
MGSIWAAATNIVDTLGNLNLKANATIASTTIVAVLIWRIALTIRQYFLLRHIPGPPVAAFTKLWLVIKARTGRTHLDYFEACQKYGSYVRISPNDVTTDDPHLIKRAWAVRSEYTKADWYSSMRFHPDRDNVASTLDENKHNELRAKLAAGYAGREVDGFETRIDNQILSLIRLLETKYIPHRKPFDFARKAQYLALDVIADVAFSEPFGFLETDSDRFDYIATLEQNFPVAFALTVLPWAVTLMQSRLFKAIRPSEKDPMGLGRLMGITKRVSFERYGPDRKIRRDMLGSFVKHGLTAEEAESETMLQVIAGSDTTAGTLRAVMLYTLTQGSRVVDRLRAEIATHCTARSPSDVISDAEACEMPYLQAIIKEALRLHHPTSGALVPRVVGSKGDTYKGMYFPPGTRIGACFVGFMRRKDIWGEDTDQFRPERWLEATPEQLREMEGAVDLGFGSGRWSCLGRGMAQMELNKAVAELFRRFDFAILNPEKPWKSFNAGMFMTSEFWLTAYPRGEGVGS